jgi:hypothetical protein
MYVSENSTKQQQSLLQLRATPPPATRCNRLPGSLPFQIYHRFDLWTR